MGLAALALTFPVVPEAWCGASWSGTALSDSGTAMGKATVILRTESGAEEYQTATDDAGRFHFDTLPSGVFEVTLRRGKESWTAETRLVFQSDQQLVADLCVANGTKLLQIVDRSSEGAAARAGTRLSSKQVSSLPLNERDFSKLLLLAAGTMTDSNGAANFTQQFSVNGQRGTASMFATDGTDSGDPEMGGATFPNFNVDAIQEVQSSSGVMPPEIGRGSAGFTNVVTRSGSNEVHGSIFEFVRNAAFDARNFFDHSDPLDPRRIPPFVRNEFGGTVGGPIILPALYNGRDRTYFFGEYQGFRQVLGTTQVFAVPTAEERQGLDTTTYSGDTLFVPVSSKIAPLLARYPLPNYPQGAFGARTYATSSKVVTDTDQFSVRVDHQLSAKSAIFGRFSLNQVSGPTTNPDQTAIDPSFGINFFDHQRDATVHYERDISSSLSVNTAFGYVRSTPMFPTRNSVDPALVYGDGLYAGFNTADGSIIGSYSNLYQMKADVVWTHRAHSVKWGGEIRLNKDATIFGTNPNGIYTFGGGTAYSPVEILSASGQHNIEPGEALPDALTGLLTAAPYSYSVTAAASVTPTGDRFDEAAVRREAYNLYVQDSWKISARWNLMYGLRYEINSRIKEAKHRTSAGRPVGPDGEPVSFFTPGAEQVYVFNSQPIYPLDWKGFGPRVSVDYAESARTTWHAGAAITTLLPNLWQDNYVTGGFPLIFQPIVAALPNSPVPFSNTAVPLALPEVYTTGGELLFPNGDSSRVAANTPIDVSRYLADVEALTPGHEPQLLGASTIADSFRNGYIGTYTAGVDHDFGLVKMNVSYVGTSGIHLPSVVPVNGYAGADASYAPFTEFNSSGVATGGYGPESMMQSGSHSTYHALQSSVSKNSPRFGLGFQASYTFSKSIDDTSTLLGGSPNNAGTTVQAMPQDPHNLRAEKGASTFDATHAFSLSLIQSLPFDRVSFLGSVSTKVTGGWQLLNVTSLVSGTPFTVYSGIQQTGAGAGGTDRPDLASRPEFSTRRTVREDYFGRGGSNASFFSIPIHVPGGTGVNQGVFGSLGRDVFRGPAFHQMDFALIKNTPFGHRGNGELAILQFRAEFFNLFNAVNFGLPANTVLGSGFGYISKTAGSSRQIQFSLKLVY